MQRISNRRGTTKPSCTWDCLHPGQDTTSRDLRTVEAGQREPASLVSGRSVSGQRNHGWVWADFPQGVWWTPALCNAILPPRMPSWGRNFYPGSWPEQLRWVFSDRFFHFFFLISKEQVRSLFSGAFILNSSTYLLASKFPWIYFEVIFPIFWGDCLDQIFIFLLV